MKEKKIRWSLLPLSAALIVLPLVACQKTTSSSSSSTPTSSSSSQPTSSSSVDKSVASIKIKEGSISSSFPLGATINYDTLVIITSNANGETLGELKYTEHSSEITHSEISTVKVGTGFVFTVTYTLNQKTFAANMTYEVVENSDLKVSKIAIVPNSLKASYVEGDVVSYDDLAIYTYNTSGTQLSYLRYSGNKENIALTTPVDTSKASEDATFVLTYTNGDGSFSAKMSYKVVTKESTYVATNWAMHSRYVSYLAAKGAASTAKDGSSAFMGIAPFRMGTMNPISLLPAIYGYDPISKSTIEMNDYSLVSVKLALLSNPTVSLTLSDYFDDVSALTTTGKIDFKSGKTGEYILSYVYDNDSDTTSFPELSYKISVVDGFNITNAKELSILNNQEIYYTGNTALKTSLTNFRSANGLPSGDIPNVVIQNDIEIKKSDLPDYYVWQDLPEAQGGPNSSAMVGTLKNQAIVFGHIPTATNPVFNIYGNYHKVSLRNVDGDSDSFPYVEETDECLGKKPGSGVNVIPEAGLFGNTYDGADAKSNGYKITINDLSSSGNQGISTVTTLDKGGVIFFKSHVDSHVNDVVVDSYFTGIVDEGGYSYTDSNGVEKRFSADMTLENSRFHNSFSAMVFVEHGSSLNVINSELLKAGGPLIISQLPTYDISGKSEAQITEREANHVVVDKESKLENWVTGTGGWFQIYNTSSYIAYLEAFSSLFQTSSLAKTLTKLDSDGVTKRYNMIFLTMKSEATIDKIIANDGSLASSFTMAGQEYINYESGRSEVNAGVRKLASDGGASYLVALNSTNYGQLYVTQKYGLPSFMSVDSKGVKHYMSASFDTSSGTAVPSAIINSKYFTSGQASDAALDSAAGDASYLSVYLLGQANGAEYDPTKAGFASDFASYKGVAPFGLVLGYNTYSK